MNHLFVYDDESPFAFCLEARPANEELKEMIETMGGKVTEIWHANFCVRGPATTVIPRGIPIVDGAWIKECYDEERVAPLYKHEYIGSSNNQSLRSIPDEVQDMAALYEALVREPFASKKDIGSHLHRKLPHKTKAEWEATLETGPLTTMRDMAQQSQQKNRVQNYEDFLAWFMPHQVQQAMPMEEPVTPPALSDHGYDNPVSPSPGNLAEDNSLVHSPREDSDWAPSTSVVDDSSDSFIVPDLRGELDALLS